MTPRQFTSFRARLDAASGFQSAQFRQLEAIVGPALFDSFVAYLRRGGRAMTSTRTTCSRRCSARTRATASLRRSPNVSSISTRGCRSGAIRHLKMVERTIGDKPGTGGSSGTGLQVDAVQAGIPRPVGDPEPAVTVTLDELRATPNALASHYTTVRCRRPIAADRALPPGMARCRGGRAAPRVRRRRRRVRRQVGPRRGHGRAGAHGLPPPA